MSNIEHIDIDLIDACIIREDSYLDVDDKRNCLNIVCQDVLIGNEELKDYNLCQIKHKQEQ